MVQEGTHNLNVTPKGYPKKFWGLFDQKAHKTQQITLFHPQKGGSPNLETKLTSTLEVSSVTTPASYMPSQR